MSDIAVVTRCYQEIGKKNSELLAVKVRPYEEGTEKGRQYAVEKR